MSSTMQTHQMHSNSNTKYSKQRSKKQRFAHPPEGGRCLPWPSPPPLLRCRPRRPSEDRARRRPHTPHQQSPNWETWSELPSTRRAIYIKSNKEKTIRRSILRDKSAHGDQVDAFRIALQQNSTYAAAITTWRPCNTRSVPTPPTPQINTTNTDHAGGAAGGGVVAPLCVPAPLSLPLLLFLSGPVSKPVAFRKAAPSLPP